ncbi:MAG TPA: hypothetical protein PLG15_01850, partial [Candidatus Gastranaerophilaceae bacterium]|nr:hypothetical protein [Candidatus Gastranaerophilaceae bacterium]
MLTQTCEQSKVTKCKFQNHQTLTVLQIKVIASLTKHYFKYKLVVAWQIYQTCRDVARTNGECHKKKTTKC